MSRDVCSRSRPRLWTASETTPVCDFGALPKLVMTAAEDYGAENFGMSKAE